MEYKIPDKLSVYTDKNIVPTILRNLISNSIKFTPKNGKIKITSKLKKDNTVEICVKDTGIGMCQKMIDNFFRPDIQTNREGTEGEASSGLGLYLYREFIEMYSVKIWAESNVGRGTAFFFTVPLNK